MKIPNDKKYSLDELCALTEFTKRTVRFYMQEGLVDRSEGQKKGAFYLEKHLLQLLEIKKWQKAGLSLDRIKEIIRDENTDELIPPIKIQQTGMVEVWSHLLISDGISLQIEPNRAGLTPEQSRELSKKLMQIYKEIKQAK